jgi:hypothetical protein
VTFQFFFKRSNHTVYQAINQEDDLTQAVSFSFSSSASMSSGMSSVSASAFITRMVPLRLPFSICERYVGLV